MNPVKKSPLLILLFCFTVTGYSDAFNYEVGDVFESKKRTTSVLLYKSKVDLHQRVREPNAATGNCGKNIRKSASKCYWIEYYFVGKRKRERIGNSKLAAENRLREVQTAKAEGRYVRKNKNAGITLGELSDWYLGLSEVKEKRSNKDIAICLKNVISRIGEKQIALQLTMGQIEQFRQRRLSEKTQTGRPAKPSTVNRDVANFKAMLNRAVEFSVIEYNPIKKIRQLEENNVRDKNIDFRRIQTTNPKLF